MLTPKEEKMDTSNVAFASPMDVTEPPNADFVTPKSTGQKLKIPGRKKVIRLSKPKLLKGARVPKAKNTGGAHPSYKEMVDEAVFDLGKYKGATRNAIKSFIISHYEIDHGKAANFRIRTAIDALVESGDLIEVKGEHKATRYRLAAETRSNMRKEAKTGAAATSPAKRAPKVAKSPAKTTKTGGTPKKIMTPGKKAAAKKTIGTKGSKRSVAKHKATATKKTALKA